MRPGRPSAPVLLRITSGGSLISRRRPFPPRARARPFPHFDRSRTPMATRTLVTLVDDLDGTTADENVSFGLEGVEYEIDLSTEHAEALREILAPYAAAARRTGGRQPSRPATPRPASPSGGTAAARSR